MLPELFAQTEADHRIKRLLREAESYRRTRAVPAHTLRSRLQRGRTRAFVTLRMRWTVAMRTSALSRAERSI
jgi:hypothetical protein